MPMPGSSKGGTILRQIVARHPHVAVRDDQEVVAGERHHVHEVAHLAAAAVLAPVDDELQVELRKLALQPVHHLRGGIGRVGHAEHDLEPRIVLVAERAQALVKLVLIAAQRLQDRHGGGFAGAARSSRP